MKAWKFDIVAKDCIGYGDTEEAAIDQLLENFWEGPYNYTLDCENAVRSPEHDEVDEEIKSCWEIHGVELPKSKLAKKGKSSFQVEE